MGFSNQAVSNARKRIKQLRRLVPDTARASRLVSRAPARAGSDDADDQLSGIDVALAQLDFAPPAGKECPPCWRCLWFEGFMPAGKRNTRMEIEDAAVRAAVKSTEARKIEIAQQVRSGTCQ